MRFLFINYEYPPIGGGSATACQQIARTFAQRGHRVVVLTAGIGSLHGTVADDAVTVVRIRALRKSPHQSGIIEMASYVLLASWRAVRLARAHQIDSTLAFFSVPGGIVARWLSLWTRIPYVVSLRGGDVPGTEPHLQIFYRVLQPLRRDILRHARAVCAPSKGLKALSEKSDPIPVQVVPNGTDTDLFRPQPERHAKVPTLLSVGRLHAQKNVGYFLDLVAEIKSKTEVRALIIGDGPERPGLEATAVSLGITDCVQFTGWLPRENVREAYQSATFLVHASNYEGMSNVILEALASGLPVVASQIPGNTELIEDGVNGFLFDPAGDPAQLANRISRLFQDQTNWDQLSAAARATIENRFSWNHAADLYEKLLTEQPRMEANQNQPQMDTN
ncbi:MAG: glycosyltransferase family 4 protein [Verrucomicrobia bacterium]|nr:glycosyltransferase family 4 protein [Verrucomicrobiota bacterium]MBV8484339.1 glycosyltransferase family 4 protein [Verrucomicrobiota bacterium]